MDSLRDARVLITGATRGVGLAATRRFAEEGAALALLARGARGLAEAEAVAREHGAAARGIPCDVGEREQVERAVAEAVELLGGLDVAVVNAAGLVYGPFTEVDPELFEQTLRTTFFGAVETIRAVLPALEASGGTLVVTGSLNARHPLPMLSSYSAAKHALRGLVGTLRIELAEQGSSVRVAMVHPGAIDTPIWHQMSSATGALPRRPPEGYSPAAVADALVLAARHPRPETLIGLETRALDLLLGTAPRVGDLVLRAMMRWFRSGHETTTEAGSLVSSPDRAEEAGRIWVGRPSLLGTARTLLSR